MQNLIEIRIDTNALEHNIANLRSLLAQNTNFMAVVKANAYGHSLVEFSKAAVKAGADWLGVVNISEAVTLREEGLHKPILILGAIEPDDFRTAANKDISAPIISLDNAKQVAETYFDKPLNVHLKIDTGLNRLGIEPKDIEQVVHILKTNRNIIIEGIYSHLASVRENDSIYTKDQIKNFKDAIKNLENAHSGKVIRHLAASGAVIMLKETHFDMVRCGIATYGLFPNQEMREKFPQTDFLVPVLSLKTKIMQIKKVLPGERVSYGGTYVAKKEMLIGILPIGYADGLPRGLSNPGGKGEVLILGERCPIVGRICMNMTIIDISNIKEQISNSDIEVTIIGKDGNKEITADELAQKSDTINHEILARLPEHIVRIFV